MAQSGQRGIILEPNHRKARRLSYFAIKLLAINHYWMCGNGLFYA